MLKNFLLNPNWSGSDENPELIWFQVLIPDWKTWEEQVQAAGAEGTVGVNKERFNDTKHTHTHTDTQSVGVSRLLWQLAWQKANSKPRALDGILTSHWRALEPVARWVNPQTHTLHKHTLLLTHTPSNRLTEVIESPFASESFHHGPERRQPHTEASRTDVCIDLTLWRQVVLSVFVRKKNVSSVAEINRVYSCLSASD